MHFYIALFSTISKQIRFIANIHGSTKN